MNDGDDSYGFIIGQNYNYGDGDCVNDDEWWWIIMKVVVGMMMIMMMFFQNLPTHLYLNEW